MKSFKRKGAIVALLFFATLLLYVCFASTALALDCNVKVVAPAEVDPNTTFTVSVIAENIINQSGGMAGWQFALNWTQGKINCTGETLNYAFWPANSGPLVSSSIDNAAGTYRQALAIRSPSTPVTGTYWLANLTFYSADTPTPVQVSITIGPDVSQGMTYCLIDRFSEDIVHGFISGQLTVVSEFLEILLLPLLMIASAASVMLASKMRKRG